MKKFLSAIILALLVALVPAGAFAQPGDTSAARYGTGTFTVGPATVPAAGCISHPLRVDLNVGYETDGWFISVNVNRADGSVADSWVSEVYFDDWGASYFEEPFQLCAGAVTGNYTASGTLHTINAGSSVVTQQPLTPTVFAVAPYIAPVVVPPVVVTPAPVTADVAGAVTKKWVDRGVQFTFKSKAIPAGTVVGDKVQWSIVSGDKVKSFSQGPSATSKKTLKFPKNSGAHKIKVLRNGKVAMRVTVRA